jgi:protein-S-isoprenylcysteine O-methyltransferase Ste14
LFVYGSSTVAQPRIAQTLSVSNPRTPAAAAFQPAQAGVRVPHLAMLVYVLLLFVFGFFVDNVTSTKPGR